MFSLAVLQLTYSSSPIKPISGWIYQGLQASFLFVRSVFRGLGFKVQDLGLGCKV